MTAAREERLFGQRPARSRPRRIEFWRTLGERLEAGEPVFLALVAENTRHSPGTAGARLWVARDGTAHGTIGGGIMEHRLLGRAAEALAAGEPLAEAQTLHHKASGAGERSGMICAGSQTNLYYVCRPEADAAAVATLVDLLEAGRSGTLEIDPEGLRVREEEPDLERPQHHLERAGEGWRYREQLLNRRRLAIFGGGHCGLALARVMTPLGYDVFAFEAAKKAPEPELGEHVRGLEVVESFRDAGPRVAYPELTWAVVMTSDMPSDVEALAGALPRPFPFLGVMGSPAKLAEIRRRLRAEGFGDDDLARLTAPVGLPIGSNTPEEIAISVAAQILQERRG